MKLLVFDKKRKCPKCGSGDISNKYYPRGEGTPGTMGWYDEWLANRERIERYCRWCQYEWAELPKNLGAKP